MGKYMNIHQYIREVVPVNIYDVFEKTALDSFLNGYSVELNSGITIIYPTEIPASIDTLKRIDALGNDFRRVFNNVCKCWRDPKGFNGEQICSTNDNLQALRYINGRISDFQLYRCKPLDLWDMTYPLKIGNQIVGVLFGGQIIVEDKFINWRKELSKYELAIDWNTCPDEDNQSFSIRNNILNIATSDENKKNIIAKINEESISISDFIKRIERFKSFGDTTQRLIYQLHDARKTAADHQFLRNIDEKLSDIDLTESENWWRKCKYILSSLIELPEITALSLFSRKLSRYQRKIGVRTNDSLFQNIPARDVISSIPSDSLINISLKNQKDFLRKINLGSENIWGYLSKTGAGYENCSTFISVCGVISEDRISFFSDLFRMICTDINSVNLIFREREADFDYKKQVAIIGHSVRTPLQALQFDLEDLEKLDPITSSIELLQKVQNGISKIRDTKEDLNILLEKAVEEFEYFNFVETLNYVIDSMQPIAKKHPCEIIKFNFGQRISYVYGVRYQVQRALTCLFDNAIKYSYFGNRTDEGGLFQIRVDLRVDGEYVKTTIKNYGIGIPEHKLKALRDYGIRGNVYDSKRTRLGTGLGLPIAIDAFESFGGWIHISSVPVDSAIESEKQKYHRYITTVEAALPCSRRSI
jgi:signal transduction histidine kinase